MSKPSDVLLRSSEHGVLMSLRLSSWRPGFTMWAMASRSLPRVSIQSTVRTGSKVWVCRQASLR